MMENVTGPSVTIASARATIYRMRQWTEQSIDLFGNFYVESVCWPYELRGGQAVKLDEFSISTTAMIIHASLVSIGEIKTSVLVPKTGSWRPIEFTKSLHGRLVAATNRLYAECKMSDQFVTHSKTWGDDDPLTLTWLYEILKSGIVPDKALETRVIELIQERIQKVLQHPTELVLKDIPDGPRAVSHVFPLLRIVQVRDSLKNNGDLTPKLSRQSKSAIAEWFRVQLYTQLSLSDIPNSEFDPASLVFALEGLLSVGEHRVNDLLIRRTLAVMQENAKSGSYWKPVQPIRIDARGNVLLPQSVEVANSLLRICHLVKGGGENWFPLIVEELFSYARWLEGRVILGTTNRGKKFVGWQSDHTHSDGLVHLWATSQTLLFCEHFGAVMQDHLARLLRESAGLQFETTEGEASWAKISDKEPLSGLPADSINRTYRRLELRFIEPRKSRTLNPLSSMLVYGPPGTGKTALAEDLARTLGYNLLIVTMSDFIQSGEAGVEARAKQIFEALYEQSATVVLFDEIDRLILSRDSPVYIKQSDMFQFMTPSMLTKLNNLRRRGTVITVIATNYEDRLDGAIKRAGRIDESILLLPPDVHQRKNIVRGTVSKFELTLTNSQIDKIAKSTPLFAYQEIRDICRTGYERIVSNNVNNRELANSILMAVNEFVPAISISSYQTRFADSKGVGPIKEVIYLAYLQLESGGNLDDETSWIVDVIREGLQRSDIDAGVRIQLDQFLNANSS